MTQPEKILSQAGFEPRFSALEVGTCTTRSTRGLKAVTWLHSVWGTVLFMTWRQWHDNKDYALMLMAWKLCTKPLLAHSLSMQPPSGIHTQQMRLRPLRRSNEEQQDESQIATAKRVDSILEQLDWPPLQQRRKKARLEMFYKFHHGLISINSKYLPKPSKSRLSSRNNNQSYDIPTCTTRYRQMAFFPRTIPEWNKLPQEGCDGQVPGLL